MSNTWGQEQWQALKNTKDRRATIAGPSLSQSRRGSIGGPRSPIAPLPPDQQTIRQSIVGGSPRPGENWEEYWGSDYGPAQQQEEDQQQPEPQPDAQINDQEPPDKKGFVSSSRVQVLDEGTYDPFIQSMEKALVMFYNPFQCESVFPGLQFAAVANRPFKINHRLASVDCSVEKALCQREDVLKTPVFKLYSNGFNVSTIRDTANFNADQMQMLIVMTPVLNQPRKGLGKEYLARSLE